MDETQAIVERITQIGPGLSRLTVSVERSVHPGQYFLARRRSRPGWTPYLRERWLPVHIEDRLIHIDRQPQDAPLAPGAVVDMVGPCGAPIPVRRGAERLLMVVQGAAPTPLVALMRQAVEAGHAVTAVLDRAARESYPLRALPPQVEVLGAPEAWAWAEQVDAIKWADQVVAFSPIHDTEANYNRLWQTINQLRAPVPVGFALGLYLPPVPCGVGACGACLVRGRRGDIHACTEGPAIDLSRVVF